MTTKLFLLEVNTPYQKVWGQLNKYLYVMIQISSFLIYAAPSPSGYPCGLACVLCFSIGLPSEPLLVFLLTCLRYRIIVSVTIQDYQRPFFFILQYKNFLHLYQYLFHNLFHNFFRNLYLSFRNCPHFAHNYLLYLFYQMKLMAQT